MYKCKYQNNNTLCFLGEMIYLNNHLFRININFSSGMISRLRKYSSGPFH